MSPLRNELPPVSEPGGMLACILGAPKIVKQELKWSQPHLLEGFMVNGQISLTGDISPSPNPASRISRHSYDTVGLLFNVIFSL